MISDSKVEVPNFNWSFNKFVEDHRFPTYVAEPFSFTVFAFSSSNIASIPVVKYTIVHLIFHFKIHAILLLGLSVFLFFLSFFVIEWSIVL